MLNFKKVLNLKFIILFIAGIFFINNTAYGMDIHVKSSLLRPPVLMQKKNPDGRLLASMTKISAMALFLAISTSAAPGFNSKAAEIPEKPVIAVSEAFIKPAESDDVKSNKQKTHESLKVFLEESGYSPDNAEIIAKEFDDSFSSIVWSFQERIKNSKLRDAEELRSVVKKLYLAAKKGGFFDPSKPIPALSTFLIANIDSRDSVIGALRKSKNIPSNLKDGLLKGLHACTVKSQEGYGLIIMLLAGKEHSDMGVKIHMTVTAEHAFVTIFLPGDEVIIADFGLGIFTTIDLHQYYNYDEKGKIWVLKKETRNSISAKELATFGEYFRSGALSSYLMNKDNLKGRDLIALLSLLYYKINADFSNRKQVTSAIYTNRGDVYVKIGDIEKAIREYEKSIGLNPEFRQNYIKLGDLYERAGDDENAIKIYKEAVKNDPGFLKAYINLNSVYFRLKRYSEAIEALKRIIELEPNSSGPYIDLGIAYVETGDLDNAIKAYEEAIRVEPDMALGYHGLANIYKQAGNLSKAIEIYKKIVESHPTVFTCHDLGDLYLVIGLYDNAISAYKKSISLSADNAISYYKLGVAYAQSKRYLEAVDALEIARRLDRDNMPEICLALGWSYYNLGKEKDGIESFVVAIRMRNTILQELLLSSKLSKDFKMELKRVLNVVSGGLGYPRYSVRGSI